ncbi:MAG: hypothetical protein JWM80_3302 [Cyanobacteria bacterium RYN_339]|nr:hypothetical protein [Cyanobacteria bacterium RYN_339]
MAIADRFGLPVAIWTGSASPHETRYVEPLLAKLFVRDFPERLIGDKLTTPTNWTAVSWTGTASN